MSYIKFDKKQLINLEYSLTKELIRSNRAGGYSSKTIIGCNSRKYHGLLVVPQPKLDDNNHVLLSNFDETVIQHDTEFNLSIHKFPGGIYSPKGHKYITDFGMDPVPHTIYRVGGVILKREMVFSSSEDRIFINYTLVDAHSPTRLKFRPFLAFRNVHRLSKANVDVNKKYEEIPNGIRMSLYPGYSYLHMQFSKAPEYTHVPDWYYNIEYQKEMDRGYEYQEDLMVPGFFEVDIEKGETITFSAGTSEINPASIKKRYNSEIKSRIPRSNFENCLVNAAQQFIVRRGNRTEIIAGFPWFGRWARDTFIALPGLTLPLHDLKTFRSVVDTMLKDLKTPLFPNMGQLEGSIFNSVDASLWFFWALQQYVQATGHSEEIWKAYGKKMKMILDGYRKGCDFNIAMRDDGLIYAGEAGKALTWMDAVVNGNPVTPRIGLPVEVNALWYNAIMFSLELANQAHDTRFIHDWKDIGDKIPESFVNTFWDPSRKYLADYVNGDYKDWSVRPNMIIAASLAYSPINQEMKNEVLAVVKKELLTKRGLRTLAPKNIAYKGIYYGNQQVRDEAYHQGTVFPWLLGHFAEAYLRLFGKSGITYIKSLYSGFEEVMTEHGIGTISEVYDGDPPHKPGGAISQAWSVAELMRIHLLMREYLKK